MLRSTFLNLPKIAIGAVLLFLWLIYAVSRLEETQPMCYGPDLESYPCGLFDE